MFLFCLFSRDHEMSNSNIQQQYFDSPIHHCDDMNKVLYPKYYTYSCEFCNFANFRQMGSARQCSAGNFSNLVSYFWRCFFHVFIGKKYTKLNLKKWTNVTKLLILAIKCQRTRILFIVLGIYNFGYEPPLLLCSI